MNVIKMQPKERRKDPFHEMCQKYVEGEFASLYIIARKHGGEVVTVDINRSSSDEILTA